MKSRQFEIGKIPVVLFGETSARLYIFIHGQHGSKAEAESFADIVCPLGWQVVGIDLPGHGIRTDIEYFLPWIVIPDLQKIYNIVKLKYRQIALRANSIGAWFGMQALQEEPLVGAIFVSPMLDMQRCIKEMMQWADVSEQQLEEKKIIPTNFNQTLAWDYWQWVKKYPITKWKTPTHMLYGEKDNLIPRDVVEALITRFGGEVEVIKNGEH